VGSSSTERPGSTTAAERFVAALAVGPGRIYPDLLPENVWIPSLRKLLSRTEWDRLRLSVGETAGMRCTVCGQPNHDPRDGQPRLPECHQVWHFDLSGPLAIQRLAELVSLCNDCHRVRHLVSADLRGEMPLVIMHLRAVNCWTSAEIRLARQRQPARSMASAVLLGPRPLHAGWGCPRTRLSRPYHPCRRPPSARRQLRRRMHHRLVAGSGANASLPATDHAF
jgi:hypothetical protein